MAVKTTLTLQGQNYILAGSSHVWVVGTPADALTLAENNMGAVAITLDNGSPISDWTATKQFGDWTPESTLFNVKGKKVFVAFDPAVAIQTKTEKFVTEFKKHIGALGGFVEVVKIPAGHTIEEFAKGCGSQDNLLERLDKASKNAAAVVDTSQGGGHHDGDDTPEADIIFGIAENGFNFHYSVEDGGFLTRKEGPKYAYIVQGGTPSLRNYLINEYRMKTGKVPTRSAVADTIHALEAVCEQSSSRTRKLAIRSAKSKITGTVWVDLGRQDGQVIGISAEKWGIAAHPDADVFFKRTDEVKELPIPHNVAPADVKATLDNLLRPAFNITDAEFPMVVSWMVAQIMPDYRAPVAMFLGESGSGKTSATSTLSSILEGVVDHGAVMPDGKDNLAVTISQEKISIWNNVSKISNAASDDICQYIDGASYKKRRLHSDSGVVNLTLNPSILLNGISFDGDLRADLKTRSLIFNMATMHGTTASIDQIVGDAMAAHGVILGALYTLCSQVMAGMPNTVIPLGASRMVDYTKTLLIIDNLFGLEGVGFAQYMQSTTAMSVDSLEDPVFETIKRMTVNGAYVQADGTYVRTFTSEELYTAFNTYTDGGRVGRQLLDLQLDDSRKITAYLKRNVTDWKKFGFGYVDNGSKMVDGVRASRKTFSFDPKQSNDAWMTHMEVAAMQKF